MDLRPAPSFFLEQIHGGVAEAGTVWLEKLRAELDS
jgi:hypothetical protein